MSDGDLLVVTCNYAEATSAHSPGAKAYVLLVHGGDPDRPVILARSRGGRWVQRYEDRRRLTGFRLKTVPPEHPLHGRLRNAVGAEHLAWLQETPDV